jgi:hypothetical protein
MDFRRQALPEVFMTVAVEQADGVASAETANRGEMMRLGTL